MTTLPDRPNTALIVIDVQKGVVAEAHDRDRVIANIDNLVDRARDEDVPVIWVQHADEGLPRDSDEWQYVPELERLDSEPLVHKSYGDSFEDTNLEQQLAERGSAGSSSPGRRRMPASARPSTVRSSAATT
jgi:nicotinamidase-related amidase